MSDGCEWDIKQKGPCSCKPNEQKDCYNGPPGTISQMVHQFQGNGLPSSFSVLYGILSQSFYQSRGVGQSLEHRHSFLIHIEKFKCFDIIIP